MSALFTPARVRQALWLGLLALLFAGQLVFWQDSQDAFGPVELAWAKVLVPLAVLPWIAWHADWRGLLAAWPGRLALAWMAWLFVSAGLSPFGADGFKTALEYTLFAALFFLPAALDRRGQRALLAAFAAGSLLSAVYGAFQHYGTDPWRWSTNFGGRPLGTLGNPNFFGGHLVLAWGLVLGWLALAAPERRRRWGLALLLLSAVQYWSRTVGVWLGLAVSAAALLLYLCLGRAEWLRRRWSLERKRVVQAVAGACVVLVLGLSYGPGRALLGRFKAEKSLSAVNRLMMWKTAVEHWKSAPLQGAGLASYRPLFPKIQAGILEREKDKGWNYVVTWLPHQNFLYLLCETGLIGLGLFALWWGLALLAGWRRLAAGEAAMLPLLLASLGMAGVSMLNTFSNIPPTAMGFAFILGLAAWKPLERLPEAQGEAFWRPVIAGAAAALVIGAFAGRELVANRLFREGARYAKRNEHPGAVKLLQRAADMGIAQFSQQSLVGIWYHLGESLRQSGRVQESAVAYEKDLQANPWAPEVHNMLGANLGQIGQPDKAAQHLRTAAWLSPGYASAMVNLGIAYATTNNYSMAAQQWEEVLKLEPGNADARNYLGMLEKLKAGKR